MVPKIRNLGCAQLDTLSLQWMVSADSLKHLQPTGASTGDGGTKIASLTCLEFSLGEWHG